MCLNSAPISALSWHWAVGERLGRGGEVPMENCAPRSPGIALQVFPCCSSTLCSHAQPRRCFGLEMSLLTAVEENVTCGCNPGSVAAAHALSLLAARFPFRFPKRLGTAGLPILPLPVMAGGGVGTFLSLLHCQPFLCEGPTHPKPSFWGLQVTSANHPRLHPPCTVCVRLGLFTVPKARLETWV